MRTEFNYPSQGAGQIHGLRWTPEKEPVAALQIIHGIAEHVARYDDFAKFLNGLGYVVVAEDHMGHGKSVNGDGVQGYFHGGWHTAVDDSYELLRRTKLKYPGIPYVLFGHSMGSFMTRTILCRYPQSGISAAVICGTGWQPRQLLPPAVGICEAVCKKIGEQNKSDLLQNLIFGSYNRKVERPRTPYDWLTRDARIVDQYVADPLCGFVPSCGLLRELLKGIAYIENPRHLAAMNKELPILLIAGGDDPVGSYGKGVTQTAMAFRKAGMQDVSQKLYPLGRHEILNEINREEVYQDIASWLSKKLPPAKSQSN